MKTQAFKSFEVMDKDIISGIAGGGTRACLASAVVDAKPLFTLVWDDRYL
ncbi:hypothetical protein [Streptococcus caviae]